MMILNQAQQIAERVRSTLAPYCVRIEIAGSIRRKKAEVKDIEIVAIPRLLEVPAGLQNLFDESEPIKKVPEPEWFTAVYTLGKLLKGSAFGKYAKVELPEGIMLDLFMPNEFNWGWIYALRTGSADFNFKYLDAMKRHGLRARDGVILNAFLNEIAVREEGDLFKLLGMAYVEPQNRV